VNDTLASNEAIEAYVKLYYHHILGARGSVVVRALGYKPEDPPVRDPMR
jgi:hypothetical protein